MSDASSCQFAEPRVSIVMNCFNGSRYLREAIDSVRAQTYADWELIFWDNQSTDDSARIVQSYGDPRIRYFRAETHTPLGQARNLAVAQAKGEWLAFLDCDDILLPNKLTVQLAAVGEDTGIVYCRTRFLIEGAGASSAMGKSASRKQFYPSLSQLPVGRILNRLLIDCFISLPSALLSRSIFVQCGGIDEKLRVAEDYDIFLKIANVASVTAVDMPLCVYRVHAGNLSHSSVDLTFAESIAVIRKYRVGLPFFIAMAKWKLQYAKALVKAGRWAHWRQVFDA